MSGYAFKWLAEQVHQKEQFGLPEQTRKEAKKYRTEVGELYKLTYAGYGY